MSTKKQVLFVDDEENILAGLRRLLRSQRKSWQLFFANSGEEALEILAKQPMDVIVSDMRMPELDGAALLDQVAEAYPHTMRVILSGQCHKSKLLQVVATAHQFLSKPCQPDKLIGSIQSALNLQDSISSPELRKAVSAVRSVPSPSGNIERLKELTIDSDDLMPQLRELCTSDIGIAIKLLQLCNSSFFGRPNPGISIQNAVESIGGDLLLDLVQTGVFQSVETPRLDRFLTRVNEHSLEVAQNAKSAIDNPELAGLCYAGGLLHDVGKIVFALHWQDAYLDLIESATDDDTLVASEQEHFGVNHREAGRFLLQLWGLNGNVVNCAGDSLSENGEVSQVVCQIHRNVYQMCSL